MRRAGGGAGVLLRGVPTFSPAPSPSTARSATGDSDLHWARWWQRPGLKKAGFQAAVGSTAERTKIWKQTWRQVMMTDRVGCWGEGSGPLSDRIVAARGKEHGIVNRMLKFFLKSCHFRRMV